MIQHFDNLFKVVKGNKQSALLTVSPAIVNYNSGKNFVAPTLDGTPFMVFSDVASAFAFADKFDGRVVFNAEAYGELIPVTVALKIKQAGWERQAVDFWAAVLAKGSLARFNTIETYDNSAALFGVLRLHNQATRPAKLAAALPAAGAAPRAYRGW